MSQQPGNKKSNTRRKRQTGQAPKATQPKQQAAKVASTASAETTAASSAAPTSRRTNRKASAQAQAKKKQQMQMLMGGVSVAVVVAIVLVIINWPTASGVEIDYTGIETSQSQIIASQGTPVASPTVTGLDNATGYSVGDPDAPVTMHIFTDFQCHYCLQFHNDTLPLIVEDFVKTGQLRLVFHDFPRLGTDSSIANADDLSIEIRDPNNESSLAAQAALCAGEQDSYLQYSDKLYGNYKGVQAGAFKRANLNRFAEDLDLNMTSFNTCMDSGKYIPIIADSVKLGQENGITATPMFILDNGSGDLNVMQQTAEGYTLIKKQIEVSIQTAQ